VRGWEASGECGAESDKTEELIIERAWQLFKADLEARNLQPSTVRKYDLLSRQMTVFAWNKGIRSLKKLDLTVARTSALT
jgi:hypothetical protein